jgi:hypothetical protein
MTIPDEIRREAERAHDKQDEFFHSVNKAAIDISQVALRTAVLINGGAAIAVLAFIGNLTSGGKVPLNKLADVAVSLESFAWGVAIGALATAFAYFTNYTMAGYAASFDKTFVYPYTVADKHTPTWKWVNHAIHFVTVLLGLGSLALFICGMLSVGGAISRLGAP